MYAAVPSNLPDATLQSKLRAQQAQTLFGGSLRNKEMQRESERTTVASTNASEVSEIRRSNNDHADLQELPIPREGRPRNTRMEL